MQAQTLPMGREPENVRKNRLRAEYNAAAEKLMAEWDAELGSCEDSEIDRINAVYTDLCKHLAKQKPF